MELERLEHEIVQLASHINAGMCRWLELVAEFDRREGWGSWGCRSCAEWVAWRCALDPRSAREHVRVARRLEELPCVRAAFGEGRLSYSKVRALTRVAEPANEDDLLELAFHATAAQLDRIVRGMRRMSTDDARAALEARFLTTWWEADGSLSVSGNLPAEQGAAFLAALDAMHDLIRETSDPETTRETCAPGDDPARDGGHAAEPASEAETCGSAEPPDPPSATNADALVAMAEVAVEAGRQAPQPAAGSSPPGGSGYEVVVHVDAATLSAASDPERDELGGGRICRLESGSALAPETVRRIACDSALVAMVEDASGEPLAIGRRSRAVPAAMRRALRARDATCAHPGCENTRFLDAHHIEHWAHGGETRLDNLVLLCRRHHTLVHEGACSMERGEDGELSFLDPSGAPLRASPAPPRGDPARLRRFRPREPMQPGGGERMDLELTLSALGARMAGA